MNKEHTTGWAFIIGGALVLLWLWKNPSMTTTTVVSAMVGALPVDPITGCPQFDSTNPASLPNGFPSNAIAPFCTSDLSGPTNTPTSPGTCSCPSGYQMWKDVATGNYYCIAGGASQGGA